MMGRRRCTSPLSIRRCCPGGRDLGVPQWNADGEAAPNGWEFSSNSGGTWNPAPTTNVGQTPGPRGTQRYRSPEFTIPECPTGSWSLRVSGDLHQGPPAARDDSRWFISDSLGNEVYFLGFERDGIAVFDGIPVDLPGVGPWRINCWVGASDLAGVTRLDLVDAVYDNVLVDVASAFVDCDGQVQWINRLTGEPLDPSDYTACTPECEGCPPVTAQYVQPPGVPWTLDPPSRINAQRAEILLQNGVTVVAETYAVPNLSQSYFNGFGRSTNDQNPFDNVLRCDGRRTLGICRNSNVDSIWGVRFTFSDGITPYPFAITLVDFDGPGPVERWRSTFGDPTIMAPDSILVPPTAAEQVNGNTSSWIESTVDSPVAQTFVWSDCRNQPPPGGVVEFEIYDANPAQMNVGIAFCPFVGVDCEGNPLDQGA